MRWMMVVALALAGTVWAKSDNRPSNMEQVCEEADQTFPELPKWEARLTYSMDMAVSLEELLARASEDGITVGAVRQTKTVRGLTRNRLAVETCAIEELNKINPDGADARIEAARRRADVIRRIYGGEED